MVAVKVVKISSLLDTFEGRAGRILAEELDVAYERK